MSRHDCPDCHCDDRTLILPHDFFPAHLTMLSTSDGTWFEDEHGHTDDFWTKIWNDLSKNYDRIEILQL